MTKQTANVQSPGLLIDAKPSDLPEEVLAYLRENSRVYWQSANIPDGEACMRLSRQESVWQISLPLFSEYAESKKNSRRKQSQSMTRFDFIVSELVSSARLTGVALKNELVVRAVLGKKYIGSVGSKITDARTGCQLNVVDATAGLGRDALLLAAAGCEVTALEKNKLLVFLLWEAQNLVRDTSPPVVLQSVKNVSFFQAYSQKYLADKIQNNDRPDIVYLDPMYRGASTDPAVGLKKTAAVKKTTRLLQYFDRLFSVPADGDSNGDGCVETQLFNQAIAAAQQKVVVKRAPNAPWLAGVKPASDIQGKAVRFDIYPC